MLIKNLKYILLVFILTTSFIEAQFYFFGRNKVQYDNFDWKVLKTEHFNIYYYGDFGEIAEIGAQYAEEAYEEHKVKFDNVVTRKIPLIFYNTHSHFQQTNTTPGFIPEGVGGFFEFIKGRVVIPFFGSLSQFRHVIRHELVHVFMTNKVYNVLRDRRFQTNQLPHLWFTEGLAEYWSTEWDTQAEMVMRDAVLNNVFVPLEHLYLLGGFLMYKEGQKFLEFVSEEYGEERILLILENMWRYTDFYKVLEFTLGEDIERISAKWHHRLKQEYYPLMQDKTPYDIIAKKITEDGFNFSPRFNKNGNKNEVYFLANKSGYTSIYKLEYDSEFKQIGSPDLILKGEKDEEFEAFHLLENSIDIKNDKLAFVSKAGKLDAIHIYSIEEEDVVESYQWDELITIEATKFSKDGNKIVFSAVDRKGFSDIYILNLHDDSLQRITNDYYEDIDPVFNKDESEIIFSSDRTEGEYKEKYNLFKINLTTRKVSYLTYTNSNVTNPKFTPDYEELYVRCDNDGTYNIWKLDFDELQNPIGLKQETNFVTSFFDYTFTDKNQMIVTGFEKFAFHLYGLDQNEIPDSTKDYISFDFTNTGERWYAEKVKLDPATDKLVYENEYNLDYAFSQLATDPVFGPRGGALVSVSDLLSDDKYIFLLYNTAETQSELLKSFNVAISRVNQKYRTNYGYGVFNLSGRRYDIRESDSFFDEKSFGGYFSLIYPFSKFQRLESSVTIANSDKQRDDEILPIKSLLVSNSVSFIHDNSLWGPTGPIDGTRFRVLLGYTSDVKFSNVNYYSFIVDYRKYFRISNTIALATRASVFYNHGKEARRYIAGGSWDLRGWNRWSVRGEKLWLSSIELRYPFIDQLYIRFPFFGLGFTSIRGAAFFDAGGGWDEKYKETLGSVGLGIRINLFNAIALRYDIGKKIENNFQSFQPKLFYQFYFGWDF